MAVEGFKWAHHIKAKSERSVAKIMATIFCDLKGILLIDYLEGQITIIAI